MIMRKQLFYIGLLCTFFILFAGFKPGDDQSFVKFDEGLYVSKFEVTTGEYKRFIDHLKNEYAIEELKDLQPDSTLWTEKFDYSFNEPFEYMYYWHPAYDNYPLVNISKKAIEKYCDWLTEQYQTNPKRTFKKVIFRLPTDNEWMLFASPLPDHRLLWFGNFSYRVNEKDEIIYLANLKYKHYASDSYDYVQDKALVCASVGKYPKNRIGIFDIIGNVAELTSDNTIKGGSWDNTVKDCYIDQNQRYDLPDPRVGFRLVMEVVEK